MPVSYRDATDDLGPLGKQLIEKYHRHLIGYPVRFAWRSQSRRNKTKEVLATAEIVRGRFASFVMTPEEHLMAGQDFGPAMFWIEVSEEAWDTLDDAQRYALLDHELCHCSVTENDGGEMVMDLRPHDLEEFNDIVKRHGLWLDDVRAFAEAVKPWVAHA